MTLATVPAAAQPAQGEAPEPQPAADEAGRRRQGAALLQCLGCGRDFRSTYIGNRVCGGCRERGRNGLSAQMEGL